MLGMLGSLCMLGFLQSSRSLCLRLGVSCLNVTAHNWHFELQPQEAIQWPFTIRYLQGTEQKKGTQLPFMRVSSETFAASPLESLSDMTMQVHGLLPGKSLLQRSTPVHSHNPACTDHASYPQETDKQLTLHGSIDLAAWAKHPSVS